MVAGMPVRRDTSIIISSASHFASAYPEPAAEEAGTASSLIASPLFDSVEVLGRVEHTRKVILTPEDPNRTDEL